MTAFVHIGIGKTGTTSIQACLHENHEKLLAAGFLYPRSGLLGIAHYGFFDLQTLQLTQISFTKLVEELKVTSAQNAVISCENLTYAPLEVIRKLREALGPDTRVVFYVREQGGLIASTFLQWVKDGWDYRGSIDEFLELHQASFDYLNLIKPWAEAFGDDNVVAHVYDPSIVGNNVAEHFLKVVGIEGLKPLNERQNPSLLPEFFDTIRALDQAGIDPTVRREVIACLLDASVKLAPASGSRLLSAATLDRICALYGDSNTEFGLRYLPAVERQLLAVSG